MQKARSTCSQSQDGEVPRAKQHVHMLAVKEQGMLEELVKRFTGKRVVTEPFGT